MLAREKSGQIEGKIWTDHLDHVLNGVGVRCLKQAQHAEEAVCVLCRHLQEQEQHQCVEFVEEVLSQDDATEHKVIQAVTRLHSDDRVDRVDHVLRRTRQRFSRPCLCILQTFSITVANWPCKRASFQAMQR